MVQINLINGKGNTMNKTKILWFSNVAINFNEVSGSGNWVLTLLNEIILKDEYDLHVAFHDRGVKKMISTHKNGITIHKIPFETGKNKLLKLIYSWFKIDSYQKASQHYDSIINSINPNIIQIFGLESPFIRILKKHNENVVVHIQGFLPSVSLKSYLRYSNLELLMASSFRSILKGNPTTKRNMNNIRQLRLQDQIYDKVRYVFGRTDADRRWTKATMPSAHYFYCQEIMRDAFYQIEWKGYPEERTIIYTTIRDNSIKNVDIIYYTCLILEKYNKDFLFEWRIAGVSSSDITPKIMKYRKVYPRSIVLLGSLDSQSIQKEMANSDLFVYPSAIENSSNAVQEAMLVGIPIIATHAGGLSSVITDKQTGILVQEGDPYALAGAIIEAIYDYDKTMDMAKECRNKAHATLSRKLVVEQLLQAYDTILTDL